MFLCFIFLCFFVLSIIIKSAIAIINTEITHPLDVSITFLIKLSEGSPKVVSIVDSRVSIETQDAARLIAFTEKYTGLLYFLYFIRFTIAAVNEKKVYAARVIVVISW